MIRAYLLVVLYISSGIVSVAQNKLIEPTYKNVVIEVHYATALSTKFNIERVTNTSVGNDMQRQPIPQFSLAVSGKVHKYLFVKTSVGTSHLHHLLDVRFQTSSVPNATTQTILSNYRAGYVYLSLLPEIRISESSQTATIYFNTGPSYYVCINNEFYGGYVGTVFDKIEMASQLKGHSFAWDINAGVDFRYKVVGVNIGFGYTSVSPQVSLGANSNVPSLGFRQLKIGLGISYHL